MAEGSAVPMAQKNSRTDATGIQHGRDQALDFTKGILVLLMVLYHWTNYFVGFDSPIYTYIRFITPSFIFIAGFLITHVYLAKYDLRDARLQKRLLERGVKLVVLFTVLNLAAGLVVTRNYNGMALGFDTLVANWTSIYITGNGRGAVFEVLVPIGYMLILSAGLLRLRSWIAFPLPVVCVGLAAVILIANQIGMKSGNLELLGVGLLGVFFGSVDKERINRWTSRPLLLVVGYLAYLIALSLWNVLYPIQILGVCLSLILIYGAGMRWTRPGLVFVRTLVLGRYTLLTYVGQIAVLQLLLIGMRSWKPVGLRLTLSLAGGIILTQLIAEAADLIRKRSKTIDQVYRAVFA